MKYTFFHYKTKFADYIMSVSDGDRQISDDTLINFTGLILRMSTRLIRTKSNPIAIESTYRNGERLWEQY